MASGSDRFKIVTHPFLPGICRVCGVPFGKRTLIDTALDADFCNKDHVDGEITQDMAGAVYFCESCVINMAELVGCADPNRYRALQQELAQAMNEIAEKNQRILGLEGIVNGYRTLRIDSSPLIGSVVSELPNVGGTAGNSTTGESGKITDGSRVPEKSGDVQRDGNSQAHKFVGEPRPAENPSWASGSRQRTPEFTDFI